MYSYAYIHSCAFIIIKFYNHHLYTPEFYKKYKEILNGLLFFSQLSLYQKESWALFELKRWSWWLKRNLSICNPCGNAETSLRVLRARGLGKCSKWGKIDFCFENMSLAKARKAADKLMNELINGEWRNY